MKVVIENVEDKVKIKQGDLIRHREGSEVYMVVKLENHYTWMNVKSGYVKYSKYDSIEDMLNHDFDDDNILVYPSDNYSLKLIKN